MDMDEIFEERITHVKSDTKQDTIDRSHAIKEHKRIAKSLDSCHWCIDSKYMLKHLIVTMDSEICLSLPRYSSLTVGHCILTPTHHIACQLQLDENVWEKLKVKKAYLILVFSNISSFSHNYFIFSNLNDHYTKCSEIEINIQCSLKFIRVATNFHICN